MHLVALDGKMAEKGAKTHLRLDGRAQTTKWLRPQSCRGCQHGGWNHTCALTLLFSWTLRAVDPGAMPICQVDDPKSGIKTLYTSSGSRSLPVNLGTAAPTTN